MSTTASPARPETSGTLQNAPDLIPPPLNNSSRILQLYSEVLGVSEDEVRRILWRFEAEHGGPFRDEFERWQLTPYEWSDRLARFYAETDCYLYGAVMWNRRPAKIEMRRWTGAYLARDGRPLQVATVGDGAGFDSLYLAQWGHEVTYSEISPRCMQFAERMFREEKVPVHIVNGIENVATGSQDAVVCLDVLEHLPDPGWMVAEIARSLRPGGVFVVHAPFFFVSPANPTHLASNRRYSGDWRNLYGSHGLYPVAGEFFWNPLVVQKRAADDGPPAVDWKTRARLALGGSLLQVGRYWNWPHVWVAHRAMYGRDDHWMHELADGGPLDRSR